MTQKVIQVCREATNGFLRSVLELSDHDTQRSLAQTCHAIRDLATELYWQDFDFVNSTVIHFESLDPNPTPTGPWHGIEVELLENERGIVSLLRLATVEDFERQTMPCFQTCLQGYETSLGWGEEVICDMIRPYDEVRPSKNVRRTPLLFAEEAREFPNCCVVEGLQKIKPHWIEPTWKLVRMKTERSELVQPISLGAYVGCFTRYYLGTIPGVDVHPPGGWKFSNKTDTFELKAERLLRERFGSRNPPEDLIQLSQISV